MTIEYPQTFKEPHRGSCQMVLVRHGQSIPYRSGEPFPTVDGHGDPPLSPQGCWQAERVALRLQDEPIRAIFTSTLTRTHQTAAPLAKALGIEPQIEPGLREVFLGEFEAGLLRERSAHGHPAVVKLRQTGNWDAIPGAESNQQLQDRVVTSLNDIAGRHPDEMVAVFCHGGVIAAALAHCLGTEQFNLRGARNGSLNYIYVGAEEWTVRSYNDSDHIGPLTRDAGPYAPDPT